MFGKLKEKLKSFKESVTQKIHDQKENAADSAADSDISENTMMETPSQMPESDAGTAYTDHADTAQPAGAPDTAPSGSAESEPPQCQTGRENDGFLPEPASPQESLPATPQTSRPAAALKPAGPSRQSFDPAGGADSEKKEKDKEKAGFFSKAKSFIFNQEIILDEDDLRGPLEELEMALLESDLALSVCDEIIASVREELTGTHKKIGRNTDRLVEDALRNAILKVMAANVFDFDEYLAGKKGSTTHLAFIGINGTGKTTSIAKIANRLKKQGYSVVIAAGDTYRAGAIDQIQIHADRLGIKVIRHQEGADPAAVIYDALQYAKAHKIDVLLSDTAGRMHTNVNLMAQLEKICRVSAPDLILFVDESTAGNDAVQRAAQFHDAVRIDGTILTKLDADSKGGAAISIAWITQSPILFFGIGQEYEDLMKFDPEWFVNELFDESA